MNPMLAEDWLPQKLRFPVILEPKIDGVRGWNPKGNLLARSMNPHENVYTTNFYSEPFFKGLDGEFVAEAVTHPRLCSLTSSALSTISGEPYTQWWLFDMIVPDTENLPYKARLAYLTEYVASLQNLTPKAVHLRVVPHWIFHTLEEVLTKHAELCAMGYEGSILRDPEGMHKQGRSSPTQGGLLRIKSFAHDEGVVVGYLEGEENQNEATVNALGKTERSTHKKNMVPNGKIGTLIVETIKDIVVNNGKKIIPAGTRQNVSAGKMDHAERLFYFQNPDKLLERLVTFQHFPKGVKDSLRFTTFHSFRSTTNL